MITDWKKCAHSTPDTGRWVLARGASGKIYHCKYCSVVFFNENYNQYETLQKLRTITDFQNYWIPFIGDIFIQEEIIEWTPIPL